MPDQEVGITANFSEIGDIEATITLDEDTLDPTYDGTPEEVTATTVPAGLGYEILYNGSATTPTNAGTYNLSAVITEQGYTGNTSGSLHIHPAALMPVVSAASKTYDGTTAAVISSRSLTGVIDADAVSLSGGTASFNTASAGTGKSVTASGLTLNGEDKDNYYLTSTTASATADIRQAALTATADNQTIDYGDPDPIFTLSYSGFVNGEDEAVLDTAPTASVSGEHTEVGTYDIVPSGGEDNNYSFSYVNGTLTITDSVSTYTVTFDSRARRHS